MGSEDQTLTVHSIKSKRSSHHSRGKHFHKNNTRKYLSRNRCYTCDEVGHFAKDCPKRQNKKKENKRRHHAHTAEDDEPSTKRIRQESDDSSSDEEYVLIFSLTGNITHVTYASRKIFSRVIFIEMLTSRVMRTSFSFLRMNFKGLIFTSHLFFSSCYLSLFLRAFFP